MEEEDLYTWGSSQGLEDFVIDTLLGQGIASVHELRDVTDEQVDIFFKVPGLLSNLHCGELKRAMATLRPSGLRPTPQFESETFLHSNTPMVDTATSIYHPSRVDERNNNMGEIQQSLATAVIREDSPFEHSIQLQSRAHYGPYDPPGRFAHTDSEDTIRLLLLGKTGNGKSTTGNTILGEDRFQTSTSFGSVTGDCERQVGIRDLGGNTIKFEIMDCPGLYDTHKTHEQICTLIVQAVAGMHPGPHAVLYVIRVGRFTDEEYSSYQRLKALFDQTIVQHVILLFTHGDQLEREGRTLEDLMRTSMPESLRTVFQECGHRYVLFNNTAPESGPQVNRLVNEVRKLVGERGGRAYSCPKYSKIGQGMEEEVSRRLEGFEKRELQRKRYVQDLEQKTRNAERQVQRTRTEFDRKERQREEQNRRKEEQRRRQEEEMKKQLRKKEEDVEEQRRAMERLQREKEEREHELKKREEEGRREEARRLREEERRGRSREKELELLLQRQQRELDAQRDRDRAERERWEESRRRAMQEQEDQRRRDLEEMERKNEEAEERRERQREAEREEEERRDRERREEMERLKDRMAKNEEPGFFGKVVNFVTAPVRAFFSLFS